MREREGIEFERFCPFRISRTLKCFTGLYPLECDYFDVHSKNDLLPNLIILSLVTHIDPQMKLPDMIQL